jgi:hypothetical protein
VAGGGGGGDRGTPGPKGERPDGSRPDAAADAPKLRKLRSSSPGVRRYGAGGLTVEFRRNGTPLDGEVLVADPDRGQYAAETNLPKSRSRKEFARDAAELYGMDEGLVLRVLNAVYVAVRRELEATQRKDRGASSDPAAGAVAEPEAPAVGEEEIAALVDVPGVLERYVEDVARARGVVREREHLKLLALSALSAQLDMLPNGKPVGASVLLTSPPGRGKNHLCAAVAAGLPDGFYVAFESSSAKALNYEAEDDSACFKHKWLYPNEAEAVDDIITVLRPLLSDGRTTHKTVNKDKKTGRNESQELYLEGPISAVVPTVRNKVDSQFQTRLLISDIPDYPGRVAEHCRELSRQFSPSRLEEQKDVHAPRLARWHAALRTLAGLRRVVTPLADWEGFAFDSDEVSHGARMWGNVLALMATHAWLEQRNREITELEDGERAIVATPEDYEAAFRVFEETCERTVVNLSATHRAILDALYELEQDGSSEGFSLRKIAEQAGVHHSTVAENRAFLTRSVHLLREAEGGGLALVAGAEPSWWNEGDMLAGFPRPEDAWCYWNGESDPTPPPESARQARQAPTEAGIPHKQAEKGVGHPTRHSPDSPDSGPAGGGGVGSVSGTAPDSANGVDKPSTDGGGPVSGASGGFSSAAERKPETPPAAGSEGAAPPSPPPEELIRRVREELEARPRVAELFERWVSCGMEAGPAAASLAYNLYGTATRHREVLPFVEGYITQRRGRP